MEKQLDLSFENDIDKMIFSANFKRPLYDHQKKAVKFALQSDGRIMLLLDIGTGKTYTSLCTAQLWQAKRIFIVCPTSVILTWQEEIEKYTDFTYEILTGKTKDRKKKFEESKADIQIINFEGLKFLFGIKKRVKDGKSKFFVDKEKLASLDFDLIIFDEFHKFKSISSIQTKIGIWLSRKSKKTLMLSGTPIAKDEIDIFPETCVLDDGKTFGKSFYGFLRRYAKQDFWGAWKIRGEKEQQEILDKISEVSIRFDRKQCLDLPEVVRIKRIVDSSDEQKKWLRIIETGLVLDLKEGKISVKNVLTKVGKLAQISGGFIKTDEGKNVALKSSPKLKELDIILDEIGDEKVIIFHQFVNEGRAIEKLCEKKNIKYASMRGEIKNKEKEYKRFKGDENCQVCINHPLSGGEGLNLFVAHIMIFFSHSYSSILRQQCEGRIYRAGQTKNCIFIDLILSESIDIAILEAQQKKQSINEILLNFLKSKIEGE